MVVLFVCIDALCPSQQFSLMSGCFLFSWTELVLLLADEWYYKQRMKCLA